MFQKGVYPYKLLDDWKKFNEISLLEKEDSNSHLIMENITDADKPHAIRVCKDLKIRHSVSYHDLFVQSDALLLADVFQKLSKLSKA